jgi:molybdate transport system ATP-binding protein
VALARAFARDPSVVLLDEPFSALDDALRLKLCAEVRAEVERLEIPAILVTHDRVEARIMGDRAIVLRDGRIEAQGSVHDVLPLYRPLPDKAPATDGCLRLVHGAARKPK